MITTLRKIKPCDMEQPFIFISYSSEDAEVVYQDVLRFQEQGYNIWLDELNLDKRKSSWKEDAVEAIKDINCELIVFYISKYSFRSAACYNEMMSTLSEEAVDLHFGPLQFIAIEVERIIDIKEFAKQVHNEVRRSLADKETRAAQAKSVSGFLKNFFNSNNEKVRIHPRTDKNRKLDYYEEIFNLFPEEARIREPMEAEPEVEEVFVEAEPKVEEVFVEAEPEEKEAAVVVDHVAEETVETEKNTETRKSITEVFAAMMAQRAANLSKTAEETSEKEDISDDVKSLIESFTVILAQRAVNLSKEKANHVAKKPIVEPAVKKAPAGKTEVLPEDLLSMETEPGVFVIPEGYKKLKLYLSTSVFKKIKAAERLKKVVFPDGFYKLNSSEFENCKKLEAVELGSGIRSIPKFFCRKCTSLVSVTFPNTLEFIDTFAFQYCMNLEYVVLPDSVTSIGDYAFSDCTYLAIVIPKSVIEIGPKAFMGTHAKIICEADSYAMEYAREKHLELYVVTDISVFR